MKRHQATTRTFTLATVTLGLCLSTVTVPATAGPGQTPKVRWDTCPKDVVAAAAPTELQCATVSVPLDYTDPTGKQIDLKISRLASANPDKRRGTLMLNPGGPGGSGLAQSALLVARGIPAGVLDTYDLIGMDTRGVGYSTPVGCGFTPEGPYNSNVPPYAPDDAAVRAQAKVAEQAAKQCAAKDDGALRHLTTANTARDLDRIRSALNEEKTSYLGYSYGTALGATYTSMFPERSDRIVLDSNLSDTHLTRDDMRRYARGMEETFPAFAKWAAARNESYGLGHTTRQVRAAFLTLVERLDRAPASGVDGAALRQYTFANLYKKMQYPQLAQVLQSLADGTNPAAGAAGKPEPAADQALLNLDSALTVFLGATCNDVKWPTSVDTYRKAVAEDRKRYPLFGAATANITPCAFWPYAPAEPPVAVDDEGPRNILLVQNLRDPATPHRNAKELRKKFTNRSRLVSVDDAGHGAYVLGDNACALNTTTRYLVEGRMPDKDRFCRAG